MALSAAQSFKKKAATRGNKVGIQTDVSMRRVGHVVYNEQQVLQESYTNWWEILEWRYKHKEEMCETQLHLMENRSHQSRIFDMGKESHDGYVRRL